MLLFFFANYARTILFSFFAEKAQSESTFGSIKFPSTTMSFERRIRTGQDPAIMSTWVDNAGCGRTCGNCISIHSFLSMFGKGV